MPRYRSRSKSRDRKARIQARKRIPRDKRKLLHWAARGTKKDYEKLRKHAHKLLMGGSLPGYVEPLAMEDLSHATRVTLTQALHRGPVGGGLSDALAHTLDKIPGHEWMWFNHLAQAALRPFRGSELTEQDEMYARLVKAGYNDQGKRPNEAEGFTRQGDYDSKYVSVWDNDNHRVVVVRGTKPTHGEDWQQNAKIAMSGRSENLVGEELRKIMSDTEKSRTVDVAAHSLGTSLTLEAYNANEGMSDRVHNTFLFNPAYTLGGHGSTGDYEKNPNFRYFINSGDIVSMGSLGSSGPENFVLRHPNSLNPLAAHTIDQWMGNDALHNPAWTPDPEKEPAVYGIDTDPSQGGAATTFMDAYDKEDYHG